MVDELNVFDSSRDRYQSFRVSGRVFTENCSISPEKRLAFYFVVICISSNALLGSLGQLSLPSLWGR